MRSNQASAYTIYRNCSYPGHWWPMCYSIPSMSNSRWQGMWPTGCEFDCLVHPMVNLRHLVTGILHASYIWFSSWNLISWTPYCLQCGLPLRLVLLISFLHLSNPQMLEDPRDQPFSPFLGDLQQPLGFDTVCGVSSKSSLSSSDLSLNYRFL